MGAAPPPGGWGAGGTHPPLPFDWIIPRYRDDHKATICWQPEVWRDQIAEHMLQHRDRYQGLPCILREGARYLINDTGQSEGMHTAVCRVCKQLFVYAGELPTSWQKEWDGPPAGTLFFLEVARWAGTNPWYERLWDWMKRGFGLRRASSYLDELTRPTTQGARQFVVRSQPSSQIRGRTAELVILDDMNFIPGQSPAAAQTPDPAITQESPLSADGPVGLTLGIDCEYVGLAPATGERLRGLIWAFLTEVAAPPPVSEQRRERLGQMIRELDFSLVTDSSLATFTALSIARWRQAHIQTHRLLGPFDIIPYLNEFARHLIPSNYGDLVGPNMDEAALRQHLVAALSYEIARHDAAAAAEREALFHMLEAAGQDVDDAVASDESTGGPLRLVHGGVPVPQTVGNFPTPMDFTKLNELLEQAREVGVMTAQKERSVYRRALDQHKKDQ